MAAAAAAIFTASSISFYDKPSTSISSCLYSLATTAAVPCNNLTTKLKSIKTLKLKPRRYPFSLTFRASVAFDSVDSVTDDDDIFDESESESESEEEIDGDEQKERQPDDSSRIYVGNLPYTMINSDLAQIFAEAGRVVSSQVVYDRVTDRSRGFAFVIMASVEEAKEAIRMFNGSQIGGRSIKVNFPEAPRRGVGSDESEVISKIRNNNNYQGFIDSPHKIYVGNLSWNLTSQGLKDAFGNQPGLLSAKVIYDRDAGRSRGFGFVTFSSAHEAQSALDTMNGMEIEGRPLRVNMAGAERSNSPYISNRQTSFDSSQLLSSIDNSLSSGI